MDWDALKRKSERDLGPIFPAHWGGNCEECGDWFDEDEPVRYEDGMLKHAECVEDDSC